MSRFFPPLLAALAVAASAATAASAAAPQLPARAALETPDAAEAKIAPWLAARLEAKGAAEFLVLLEAPAPEPPAASREALVARLAARAAAAQERLLAELAAAKIAARPFYLVNAVLVAGDGALAREIARRPEVARLVGDPLVAARLPVPAAPSAAKSPLEAASVEWNVAKVNAPSAWSATRGEGIVVGSADTGADWTHPALKPHYRGYDAAGGAADHRYSWHDAFGQYAAPTDPHGHGTHTIGTMVGDDGAANQVGVAPGARWIACRNMDAGGSGSPASYLECLQFLLAPWPPGGDPSRDGRPDLGAAIVNNSWTCPASEGCDADTLRLAFARLRRAGVFAVDAAGNAGPQCGTVADPPAIYADVVSVAATTNANALAGFSGRGPVTRDGSGLLKPDVSAPGVSIRSAVPGGGYGLLSGTSMASPHVAGVAALLWAARPTLRGNFALTRCALTASAARTVTDPTGQSCGGIAPSVFPNAAAGAGLVDAAAAFALADADGDGAPDVCDCAPADATAFAVPEDDWGLRFGGATTLVWSAQAATSGSATRYDVVRGNIAGLPAGAPSAVCLLRRGAATSLEDAAAPTPGRAFFYVERAVDVCGGDYGRASSGATRPFTACD